MSRSSGLLSAVRGSLRIQWNCDAGLEFDRVRLVEDVAECKLLGLGPRAAIAVFRRDVEDGVVAAPNLQVLDAVLPRGDQALDLAVRVVFFQTVERLLEAVVASRGMSETR